MEIRVTGAEELAQVARDIKKLGNGREIITDMRKEIRSTAPPFRKAVRENAIATLPSQNGLNEWVAGTKIKVSITTGRRSAGVRFVGGRNSLKKKSDIRAIDKGRVRAPLFGDRRFWHLQNVKSGFFTKASPQAVDEFRQATVRAIDKAVRRVWG